MDAMKPRSTNPAARAIACVLAAGILAGAPALAEEAGGAGVVRLAEDGRAGYVVVTEDEAEVVVRPGDDAAVLEIARDGDVYPYRERRGEWYLVVTAELGEGWIHGESAALLFYPEYLLRWQPPEGWEPPETGWEPPPGWVPGPGWVRRRDGWTPPPHWSPAWWGKWYHRKHWKPLAPRRHREPGWKPRHPPVPPRRPLAPGPGGIERRPLPPR